MSDEITSCESDLEAVIEHLEDTDGTGDPEWMDYLIEEVSAFKKWKVGPVRLKDIQNDNANSREDLRPYIEMGDSEWSEIVLIPSDNPKFKWFVIDGAHRAAALKMFTKEKFIGAYYPEANVRPNPDQITASKITSTIKNLVKTWLVEYGYRDIRDLVKEGHCADLATIVWEELGRPTDNIVQFMSSEYPCHTWIKFDGLHYGMMNPEGAPTQADMDEFSRLSKKDLADISKEAGIKIEKNASKEDFYEALGWNE